MTYYSKTIITYTSGATIFSIPFDYNDPTEIHVYVNSVETLNFTIENGSVNLSDSLSGGDEITIQRVTDISKPAVDYSGGSGLTTDDLNRASSQLLHIAQESVDLSGTLLTTDITDTHWQGQGKKISDVANGIVSTDVATVGQIQNIAAQQANLPNPAGQNSNYIRQKSDNTGLEYRTPTQVRSDIDASQSNHNHDSAYVPKIFNTVSKNFSNSPYSVPDLTFVKVDSTGGAVSVILPVNGKVRVKWSAGTNSVTLSVTSGGTINGASTYVIKTLQDCIDVEIVAGVGDIV